MRMLFASLAALALATPVVAGTVDGAVVERVSPDKLVVRWSATDPVDVLVADKPDIPASAARVVSKADNDGSHELVTAATSRPYIILRDTRGGRTVRVAERVVTLQQGSNFRDLGGYPAAGGKHVRWGLIYRSGATPLLTDADLSEVRLLGLGNMVDLRSSEERVLAPTRIEGVPYSAIGYSMADMMTLDVQKLMAGGQMEPLYRQLPTFLAPHLRLVFARLLSNEGPLVYNCSAGQDRTGFVSAMILSALGAPREAIIADFHMSTELRRPEFEMPKIDLARYPNNPVAQMFARGQDDRALYKPRPLKSANGAAYLDSALAAINERWGSVDGYFETEIGLSKADIAQLRTIYLE
ncbi:tyrosine-protein phosphatase [Phenylobacterium sp.]|jgi:protein-tyrosine phosphatase|uniref:tyrosine-protein phosphatase n=1 Tax=Phenylobacterium sp. TaxID=1871053 RepID=UPI0037838E62